jgi:hypothetical protein
MQPHYLPPRGADAKNMKKIYGSNRGYSLDSSTIVPSWYDSNKWVGCALVSDDMDLSTEDNIKNAFLSADNDEKEIHIFSPDSIDFDDYDENCDWGDGIKNKPGSISAECLWIEEMKQNKFNFSI